MSGMKTRALDCELSVRTKSMIAANWGVSATFADILSIRAKRPLPQKFWKEVREMADLVRDLPAPDEPSVDDLKAQIDHLRQACTRILPYLRWTVGDESPGHHPTMPSAVAAFQAALGAKTYEHHRFGSPPRPVVNPSEAWCDAYADWYHQGRG